jgi:hypothetical protein
MRVDPFAYSEVFDPQRHTMTKEEGHGFSEGLPQRRKERKEIRKAVFFIFGSTHL